MTEKRFTIEVLDKNNWLIEDTKTGENANPVDGTTNVLKGLISTLNKFNDENEELKSKNRGLQSELQIFKEDVTYSNLHINKLSDDNEQLKKNCKNYEWYKAYKQLLNENEQLKSTNMEYEDALGRLEEENQQLTQKNKRLTEKIQIQQTSHTKQHLKWSKQAEKWITILIKEKEQLKKELKEFKDFVYSDEKILCYTCKNCLSKGIYQIECSEKGKVDVHGSCFAYWKKELKE